jgi:hypothetical protein
VTLAPQSVTLTTTGSPKLERDNGVSSIEILGEPIPGMSTGSAIGPPPPPFRYFDEGNLAVIGKKFASLEVGKLRTAGRVAFLVWAVIHLIFLGSPGNRFRVAGQWPLEFHLGSTWLETYHGLQRLGTAD